MYNVRRTRDYYSREAQLLDILARDYDSAGYYGDDLLKEAGIFDSLVSRFRGLGSRAARTTAGASGSTATVATAAPTTRFNPMNSQAPEMFADTVGVAPLRGNKVMSMRAIPEGGEAATRKMQAYNPYAQAPQAQTVRMQAIPEGQIPMSAPRVDPVAQTQAVPLQRSATVSAPARSSQAVPGQQAAPLQQPAATLPGLPAVQSPMSRLRQRIAGRNYMRNMEGAEGIKEFTAAGRSGGRWF
jgi:hypothetical protein